MAAPIYHYQKETYVWESQPMNGNQVWIRSQDFQVGCIPNCKLFLSRQVVFASSMNIAVNKSSEQPVDAVITVQIGVSQKTELVNGWSQHRRFCNFKTFGCLRADIICEIVWMLREVPELPPSPLHQAISGFLLNPNCSDVTIVVNDVELPAHKLILSGYSLVFAAMLNAPMREAAENRIEIRDTEVEVIRFVLMFMYTGSTEALNDVQVATKVLAVAEKYEIERLKDICEDKLIQKLRLDNTLQIFGETDQYRVGRLKEECLKLFVQHRADFLQMENFRNFCMQRPALMYEITTAFANRS